MEKIMKKIITILMLLGFVMFMSCKGPKKCAAYGEWKNFTKEVEYNNYKY